jgi:hypothetical protein
VLLRFRVHPGAKVLADLARRGVNVVASVPGFGLIAVSNREWSGTGLALEKAGPIAPAAKIARELEHDGRGAYLVVFHADISKERGREVAENAGLQVLERDDLLPGHLLVAGAWHRMVDFAGRDEVARILPPSTDLLARRPVRGCSGPIIQGGPVADYALEGARWTADPIGTVVLHFVFDNVTAKLNESVVRQQVGAAFAEWASHANLSISAGEQIGASRAIDVLFATGSHGDAYPFISSSTLAHAFYPTPDNPEPLAGDIHFNDVESWNASRGVDLFSVALHEAGHSLGLAHSSNPESAMYPYYHAVSGLVADDIAAIQAFYGKPVASPPPANPPSTPPVTPPPVPPQPPSQPSGGADTVPPSLVITSPGSTMVSAYSASITIAGNASDNVGVTSVTWSSSTGGSGKVSGTTSWSATVPLLVGNTTVTVRAYDAAGNSSWRSLTVVRVN